MYILQMYIAHIIICWILRVLYFEKIMLNVAKCAYGFEEYLAYTCVMCVAHINS